MSKLTGRINRPSPAMIVAIIALVAALTGGAYAAKKIGTKQLANKSVTTKKITKIERSQGFFSRQTGDINLPNATDLTVATLNLPSTGNFQVTSVVDLAPSGAAGGNVRCQLRDDGAVIAAGDERMENALAGQFMNTNTLTAFANGGVVTLTCTAVNGVTARDRVLAATRVARLEIQ